MMVVFGVMTMKTRMSSSEKPPLHVSFYSPDFFRHSLTYLLPSYLQRRGNKRVSNAKIQLYSRVPVHPRL